MSSDLDLYRVPALALLAALTAVFAGLWVQRRRYPERSADLGVLPNARSRQLLWLSGWMFAVIRLETQVSGTDAAGFGLVLSRISIQLAGLMFLASLAPQFLFRRPRVPFVAIFAAPLIFFIAVVSLDLKPGIAARAVLVACAAAAFAVALWWGQHRSLLPGWLRVPVVGAIGAACVWLTVQQHYSDVLALVHSGVLLVTALLFVAAFRRLTVGLLMTAGGLIGWSLPIALVRLPGISASLLGNVNLMKVIAAVGMIVLVLEDEIASNQAAQQRDRRARIEMEKYAELYLAAIPFEEEDTRELSRICATITAVSRFRQAALLLRAEDGCYRLSGQSGMAGALEAALDSLARRTSVERAAELADTRQFTREVGHLILMDLTPLMEPGDELLQLNFREAHVIGMRSRDGRSLGALLLADLRQPETPLLADDVLPLELLVARMAASREHQELLRQLIQAERLAGLGQLAGGVAHELNNPLTVVTGYAELMSESSDPSAREQALVILNEARRMRQIIESLLRFRKASPMGRAPVSLAVLLQDIEKLARHDLEIAGVTLHLHIAENLPRVMADGEQMRHVFLQVMKNAIASMDELPPGAERRLTVDVVRSGRSVQVTFTDSGPGFAEPTRAFDPFFTTRGPGQGMGLGLSICYSIVREHGGEISAANLHTRGSAVVIELPGSEDQGDAEVMPPQVHRTEKTGTRDLR